MMSSKPSKFGKMKKSMPSKSSPADEMDLSELGESEAEGSPAEESMESPDEASMEGDSEAPAEGLAPDELAKASDEDLMAEMERRGLSAKMGEQPDDSQEQYS